MPRKPLVFPHLPAPPPRPAVHDDPAFDPHTPETPEQQRTGFERLVDEWLDDGDEAQQALVRRCPGCGADGGQHIGNCYMRDEAA